MPPSPRPAASPSPPSLPRLYAILDVECCAAARRAPLDVARAFLSAGVTLMQLRAKAMDSGAFLDLALALVADASQAGAVVVVNDRADIAVLSGAQGLHLGQDDLAPADARVIVGPECWVGLSTHTESQWRAAIADPIGYVAIGPVFDTGTKATGHQPVGTAAVSRVAAATARPVVAIGGITLERAPGVIAAGAAAVAVISDLLSGAPEARARAFLTALG